MEEENAIKCILLLKNYFHEVENSAIANVKFPKSLEVGSEEWLYYIFYSCLLDYGMKSKLYHNNLINTYQKYPHIFKPKYVVEHFNSDEVSLLQIMKENIHPRYPNVSLRKWMNLSKKLVHYPSLLKIVQSIKSIDELNLFIKEIGEYGQKTGGLLTRLILESKIVLFSDELTYIPIDRHDIEISYYNGVSKTKNPNAKELEMLSKYWINAGKKAGLSPTIVDKYLWEIGNSFCSKKNCVMCPLKDCFKKNE